LGDPFASKLEVFPWLKLQVSMGVERGESEKKGGPPRFGKGEELVNNGGERREGVNEWIFSMLAHGLKSGVTGQTGDRPWSSQ
jgi:hypothetical protein